MNQAQSNLFNPALRNALISAKKKEPKRKVKQPIFKNKKPRIVKTDVVVSPVKTVPTKSVAKKEKFNYPAGLVKGRLGKYHLFINHDSGIKAEVVVDNNGRKYVRILSAIGVFAYMTKGNVHERWYVPHIAIGREWFDVPARMNQGQKHWTISVVKDICRLNRIFEIRMNRKK